MTEVEKSVYRVVAVVKNKDGKQVLSSGTAFHVSGANIVVTSQSAVNDLVKPQDYNKNPTLYIFYRGDGRVQVTTATIRKESKERDIAIIAADATLPGVPLTLADFPYNDVPVGSDVKVLSYPEEADLGKLKDGVSLAKFRDSPVLLTATKTDGRVSRTIVFEPKEANRRVEKIQHQAPISSGSGGSPLLDICGSVIGMNVGKAGDAIGYANYSGQIATELQLLGLTPTTTKTVCNLPKYQQWMSLALPGLAGLIAVMALILALQRPKIRSAVTNAFVRGQPAFAGAGGGAGRSGSRTAPTNLVPRSSGDQHRPTVTGQPEARPRSPEAQSGGRGAAATKFMAAGGLSLVPDSGPALQVALDRLSGAGAIVGRNPDSDVHINDATVSTRHARLKLDGSGRLVVEDLGSSNGTWQGGTKLTGQTTIAAGSSVRFGNVSYRVELPGGGAAAPVAATVMRPEPMTLPSWRLRGRDDAGNGIDIVLTPRRDGGNGGAGSTEWVLGRTGGTADHMINDPSISGRHARLRYVPGRGLEFADAGSSNGSKIDGRKVGPEFVALAVGQSLTLGKVTLNVTGA